MEEKRHGATLCVPMVSPAYSGRVAATERNSPVDKKFFSAERGGRASGGQGLPVDQLVESYRRMLRIRMVEEAIADHYGEGEMRCPVHLSIGQEAAAVAVCDALTLTDKVYSTHRCHAHYLAKGGDLKRMLAEIYGKDAGCIGGRGGSMHLMDVEKGMMASVPIVASSIPIAVGSALADKRINSGKVTAVFVGDASIEEGVFHESANFAVLHNLPVVFICENNLYSVYTPLRQRQPDRPLTDLARAHAMETMHGDGNNFEESFALATAAVSRARDGRGPTFVLLDTYRWREHCGPNFDNHIGYRTEAEYEIWKAQCPVTALRGKLGAALATEDEAAMVAEISAEIQQALDFAHTAPLPEPGQAALHVYA
jgi:pyruvate dehydrogenase E1 component alpha subunit